MLSRAPEHLDFSIGNPIYFCGNFVFFLYEVSNHVLCIPIYDSRVTFDAEHDAVFRFLLSSRDFK